MKKTFFLIVFLCGIGVLMVSAQNPIPSYNVPVYHVANFQEQQNKDNLQLISRGKREVVVQGHGTPSSLATVYVYSLDYLDLLGPFTIHGGETLRVEIDSREWGVFVESQDHLTMDVWIEEEAKMPSQNNQEVKDPCGFEHLNRIQR